METTDAVEDYLKAIYHLSYRGEEATPSRIAQWLGVSTPSVSGMVKRLSAGGLVTRPADGSVALTGEGEIEALRVVRRHRLVETFLVEVLGVGWDEVHDEAEILEHAVSDRLEERIDDFLGHPTHDPHGDPIPPRSGTHDERWADPLSAAPEGVTFRVERVSDRDAAVLRYLADLGIRPGTVLTVEDRAPFGGPLWVRMGSSRHALGAPLARLVHGSVLNEEGR